MVIFYNFNKRQEVATLQILNKSFVNGKKRLSSSKSKEQIRELKRIFDWVEEVSVKLQMNIVTQDNLEKMTDIQYLNKWIKYIELKNLVEEFIDNVLDIHDGNMDILDKIKEFKKVIQIY